MIAISSNVIDSILLRLPLRIFNIYGLMVPPRSVAITFVYVPSSLLASFSLVLLLISIAQPLALRPSPTSAFFPALLMVAAVAVVVVVVVVPSSVLLLYRHLVRNYGWNVARNIHVLSRPCQS